MGKYRRLGKNTLLMFLGDIGSKSLSFLMLPFYTSFLSVADYGTVDLIQVYVQLLVGLCTCTLTEAIFVFPKGQTFAMQQTYFTSGLLFSAGALALTGVLFAVVVLVLRAVSYEGIFTEYNLCIFLMLCATFFQSYTQQFARSIERVNVYVVSGVVLTLTTVLTSLVTLPLWGLHGYVYSIIVSYFAAALYSVAAAREHTYFSLARLSWPKLREMLRYSIPMMPNGIMWWVSSTMNRPILEHYSGIEAIGIFAVANKFPLLISMLYTVFTYSWQISVLEEFGKPGYREFYNKVFHVQFLVFVLFVLGITFLSRPLIGLMTTADYHEAWQYVPVLSLSVVFSNLAGFAGTNFAATKESRHYFTTSFWGGLLCLALNFLLIPRWGLWGATSAILASYVLTFLLRAKVTWKYSPIARWGLYLQVLSLVCLYILVYEVIPSLWLNSLLLLCVLGAVALLNRDCWGDLTHLCKLLKRK